MNIEAEQRADTSEKYSEYYRTLKEKWNWQIQMPNATSETTILASSSSFAKQTFLYLESLVYYHVTPPGFIVKRDNFNSYQIVYTLSGQGFLSYLGKDYILSTGNYFILDCRKPHYYYTYSDEPWVHHGLQFNGHQMPSIFQYLLQLDSVVGLLPDTAAINQIHENLKKAATSGLASADIIINQLLNDLLCKILLCNQVTSRSQLSSKISEVCDYINSNYRLIRSIDDIAQNCFISKYYMCHEFKRQTGKTISTFLKEKRLYEARLLLIQTDFSVADIAEAAGFDSLNYFFSVFKENEGITPLQYRKQYKTSSGNLLKK